MGLWCAALLSTRWATLAHNLGFMLRRRRSTKSLPCSSGYFLKLPRIEVKLYQLPYPVSLHTILWAHCVSGSWHRTHVTSHRYAVAGQSASSSPKQSGHCLPTCDFDETTPPKIHSRGFSRALIEHPELTYQYVSANHIQRSLVLESSFNFERVIFRFRW